MATKADKPRDHATGSYVWYSTKAYVAGSGVDEFELYGGRLVHGTCLSSGDENELYAWPDKVLLGVARRFVRTVLGSRGPGSR